MCIRDRDKEQTTEQAQPAQEATKQSEAEAAAQELPEETAPVQDKEAQPEPVSYTHLNYQCIKGYGLMNW